MITIWADDIASSKGQEGCLRQDFHHWRDSDAFTAVKVQGARDTVPGALYITSSRDPVDVSRIGNPEDRVRLIARYQGAAPAGSGKPPGGAAEWIVKGYVLCDGDWQERPVQVVPLREDLWSRTRGILDTPVLSEARVLVCGLGSVGSFVAEELAKAGVTRFMLLDDDRVTVGNLARQNFYVPDAGRLKTRVVAERILGKNPYATIETHEVRIRWETREFLRGLVRQADIVVVSVDNREGRTISNVVCVEEKKPAIFMGASHRGYKVQVLFVRRPGIDPCYQCFLMSLPPGEKTSGLGSATPVVYADRPVPQIEPALSVDLTPMNTMVTKLCVQRLLEGKTTSLRSLDDDLIAPLYLYVNRREGPFERLAPLGFNVGDGPHILSWWGVDLKRNPACPVCGDYVGEMAKRYGIVGASGDGRPSEDHTEGAKDGD
jgi:molybdopterin/thiamine biosynthesis adenylyltransferase